MNKRWDVLGIGCTTVDDLLSVDAFPEPDFKTRVQHAERQAGGLSAIALIAAARLGAACAYGGQLGFDEFSNFMVNTMTAEGIDLEPTVRHDGGAPFHSIIIVDTTHNTRNIFFHASGEVGPVPGHPTREEIAAARVLFIDHYGGEANIAAVTAARELGVPVVADIERTNVPNFADFYPHIDHLILSRRFASQLTDESRPERILNALWNPQRQVVAVTSGEEGCWTLENGDLQHFPAFPVHVVDTTGCGDVFHGVYAATLAWGWPLDKRIRYATASAAIKAGQRGAQKGIPGREAVEAFLRERCP